MKFILTMLSFVSLAAPGGAAVLYTNTPDKDAFVRSLAPTNNYGGGGALSVSGTNSTSPLSGATNGAFDTFISFNTGAMVTNFNTAFGANKWVVTSATLVLTENAMPGNAIFNYGTGAFEIRWIANDTWSEGSGTPMAASTNGGITYNQEPAYLNAGTDANLGSFTFTGTSPLSCALALPSSFVNNMQAGGEVGLFMTAIDPGIGFVFYSRQYAGLPSTHPALVISAVEQPVISAINLSGANLVLSATNIVAGGTYYLLTSTNLGSPINQWTPIQTNVPAANNFMTTVTNAARPPVASPQFFILQTY